MSNLTLWRRIKRPPWRTIVPLGLLLAIAGIAYLIWSPGERITDGRHDLGRNGIWLQHGWLGDDGWFVENGRDRARFRDPVRIESLAGQLSGHGIRDVFPHLCPCRSSGTIAAVNDEQVERFLDRFDGFRVIPWIGGVLGTHCFPSSADWRAEFVRSAVELLEAHPRFAGVQVNIEPLPTGKSDFLLLLEELKASLPPGKILSVAAYPPPTILHRFPEVHWDEPFFREVAERVDQMVPMMYDTSIRLPKFYQNLMRDWTTEVLVWAGDTEVLLGVPAYDDAGVGYHHPQAENLRNALRGIHASLSNMNSLPDNYSGISVYSEWEMDAADWKELEQEFGRTR